MRLIYMVTEITSRRNANMIIWRGIIIGYSTNTVFWDQVLWAEFDHRACEVINPTKERDPKTLYEFNNRIIIYLYKIINFIK